MNGTKSLFEPHFYVKATFVKVIFWRMYGLTIGKNFEFICKNILLKERPIKNEFLNNGALNNDFALFSNPHYIRHKRFSNNEGLKSTRKKIVQTSLKY